MALTDTFVRQTKHSGKEPGDKHSDGGGLYIFVRASGKYWRLNYRFEGKQKTLTLGVYPAVTLAAARKLRDQAREQLGAGDDPSAVKKAKKEERKRTVSETFEAIGRQWLEKTAARRGPKTQSRVQSWLDRDVFPAIGSLPISALRPRDILGAIARIEARGAHDSARRVLGYCGQIFEYAMLIEAVQIDITVGLHRALEEPQQRHYAAITEPEKVGALLRSIDAYDGHPFVRAALKLAPMVFVRPGELRTAEWCEIDLYSATWSIPAVKMKMGSDHIVPLAQQAVDVLRDLQAISGSGRFCFPSIRTGQRPMSDNTVNAALRSMGYSKEVMTGHGFRALARTIMDEVLGERVDLIEHQLAHQVKDVNGRAYNRTAHLPARREMMKRWADYLENLRLSTS
ncbi:phage integrase family protein [Pseudoduganella lurida]|uniref:Phage integrase family protein n=1 Tax=Pseudoduganella lurida TaxID=1036180 RepID=A0A562R9U8_9BURK|nr:integrase arm-type DNA-binding domain-containing protein [Pseudoduganella lurida]TWI65156.1 phage integrase family protein [Pseudoduganella lurida]